MADNVLIGPIILCALAPELYIPYLGNTRIRN